MKKRWMPALLALLLVVSLLPAPVRAAAAGDAAGNRLTGMERTVYDYLKAEITKVAKGTRASTEFKIPDQSALSWPMSELGATGTSVSAKVEAKLAEVLNIERVFQCLSLDCPYEMFWRSDRFTWGYSLSREGNRASVKNLLIRVDVAQSYRGGNAVTANSSKIAAANQVLANAQAIVDKYRDLSDMDKLTAYVEEICGLVSYDAAAARGNVPYGDPWQMIYVFDGDPATNVVCEGYSKAFQHLCDLSQFSGNVLCRTVSGKMGRGNHMWNVVRMGDGKNYLVDVTNCDSGTVGANGGLFLTGAAGSADGRTYTVSKDHLTEVYTYDEDQKGLYTDGYLRLGGTDYVPGFDLPAEPDPSSAVESGPFADVDPGAYYAGAVAWAVEEGVTNGTSETTFSPDQTCTEAEVLTFLWRAAGKPANIHYGSTGVGPFWRDALLWYCDLGMIAQDGSFDARKPCTRASAVSSIWWAFGHPENQVASFTDVPSGSPCAYAVGWAVLNGVTTGTSDDTFDPDAVCTRGQIVTFLYRAYH